MRNLIIMIYNRILEMMYGGEFTSPPKDDYARIKLSDDFALWLCAILVGTPNFLATINGHKFNSACA